MADILTANPQIDAVYSLDDETSIGALQAIEDAGRTDIKAITGGGGCQEYFNIIKEKADEIHACSALYSPLMIKDCRGRGPERCSAARTVDAADRSSALVRS